MSAAVVTYDELRDRLREAEEVLSSLMSAQTDAVISNKGVYVLRLDEADRAMHAARDMLEGMLKQRTEQLSRELERTQKIAADLRDSEAALRRSNDELRQFAYAAAHDLQEPLRNVFNSLGMLKRHCIGSFEDTSAKWIDIAQEGTQRIYDMVNDLLSYARAVELDDEPLGLVSAADAVNTAIANLHEQIVRTGAKLHVASLPSVHVNASHLVQLFENLLSNALKFRKPAIAPEIRIYACMDATQPQFSVSDNGIGFDPEYSEKIFGVFRRLHQRHEYPGNGIGLAICARIVSHYGGRIWAESQPGEGATFHFTLPAARNSQ